MHFRPVFSFSIRKFSYDRLSRRLLVDYFDGRQSICADVPPLVVAVLQGSSSPETVLLRYTRTEGSVRAAKWFGRRVARHRRGPLSSLVSLLQWHCRRALQRPGSGVAWFRLIQLLEEFLDEIATWLLFYPRTFWIALRRPSALAACIRW
jgi:hypothetical protein